MNAYARVVVLALFVASAPAAAQEKPGKRDDLDVTMQIIVDPNAKLPDEVVRHIPLPASRTSPSNSSGKSKDKSEPAGKGAEQTKELGRENAEAAKERAREAAQQREEARNAKGKDGDPKDKGPPDRPNRPRPNG